jgi:hypothetical protein
MPRLLRRSPISAILAFTPADVQQFGFMSVTRPMDFVGRFPIQVFASRSTFSKIGSAPAMSR